MKVLLSLMLLLSSPWLRDDPFIVELTPTPEEASPLYLCTVGSTTIANVGFFISDDAFDGIPTAWEWSVAPSLEMPEAVLPQLSTAGPLDNVSGELPDGSLVRDVLLINGFGATEAEYTLKLFVYSKGGEFIRIFEYTLIVGGSTAAFTLDASPRAADGSGVLCRPQGPPVTLSTVITETPRFPDYTFQWSVPGQTTETIQVERVGNYSVTVTNGCGTEQVQSVAVRTGTFPNNVSHDFPLPTDPVFRACPDGEFYLAGNANNATDFQWQVHAPGEPDFKDITGFAGNPVTIPVDDNAHRDGSEYRLVAINDGCRKTSEDPPISLKILGSPQLSTTDLEEATVPIGEMTMYQLVVNNTYGKNTCFLWELIYFDQDGLEQRDTLKKEDGALITAADAAPAGMEIPLSGTTTIANDMVVGWEITVTELFPEIQNIKLVLTNLDNGTAKANFRLKFSAVTKDDNSMATTGAAQLECSAAVTEESNLTFLPIELVSFSGEKTDQGILLRWATATEQNNDFFTLERSFDGRSFLPIATVPGAGTTYEPQNYFFYDQTLPPAIPANIVYYRLRQTDFDGRFSYSDVILIDLQAAGNALSLFRVFTAGETLFFQYSAPASRATTATLFDYSGRRILRQTLTSSPGANTGKITLPGLPAGIYVLRISDGVQEVSRRVTVRGEK